MLSILIPTYNYNAIPLVSALLKQLNSNSIILFEIIVLDDGSKDETIKQENFKINMFSHCRFEENQYNLGRAKTRNLLAQKAKYDNLLFLDVDTTPIQNDFILKYIIELKSDYKIIYGGIKYQENKPKDSEILRWTYGKERESLTTDKRQKNTYLSFLTLNFLIKKNVFDSVRFNESIPNLRHEDTLFSYNLMQHKIPIRHITNPVYHLGLDTNEVFLKKTEESVEGLYYLTTNNLISHQYTRLSKLFNNIQKLGLKNIITHILSLFEYTLKKNILSNNPSLYLFDLYRLLYLLKIRP